MKRNKKEDILLNTDNDDISMLAEIQTDPDEVTAMEFNKEIPVMPLRNMVMFPSVVMPVTIGRPSIEIDKCCIQEKTSHSGSLSDTGRHG